jgi:hypothetical protein
MSTELLAVLVAVPAVVVVVTMFLVLWRERTSPRTAAVAVASGVVLAAWGVATAVAAARGVYAPPPGNRPPPIGLQLLSALAVLGIAVLASPSLRSLLRNRKNLLRLNLWRLEGAVFVALMFTGQMPALWALPAGIGDVLVGLFAFGVARRLDEPGGRRRAVLFNLLGLLDLVVAVGLGVTTSPGPANIFHTVPTSELVTHFPLALVPGFLVPMAFMLHLVSLWQLSRGEGS